MTDTGPLFVSSGDLIADRRYKWALDHAAQGDFSGAADILAQTVELAPGFATAWFALGAIRDQLGDRDGAIAAFEKARDADPDDYHGARLQLARLGSGEAAPAMSESYVRRLFDQYAARYDCRAHGAPGLSRTGGLLRDAVEQQMGAMGRPLHFPSMLDLGCGTGLGGAVCSRNRRPARRRRSFARHDRAGGKQGPYDHISPRPTSTISSSPRRAAARNTISSSLQTPLCLCQRSDADHGGDRHGCWRPVPFSPLPRKPMPATACSFCRRSVVRMASHTYAARYGCRSHVRVRFQGAVRSEKGDVPVDSLVVVALVSTPPHALATSEG